MVNPAQRSERTPADQGTQEARGQLGLVWVAGLVVALGAGVATAHGLYEVAMAAGTPRALAWLYPLITDGLALVAYATTTRLAESGRRYAWTVVVIAAGLSGLTQAGYLAGGVAQAPPVLRFAIGAWPAIAAATVAHLLYLLGTHHDAGAGPTEAALTAATEDSAARGEPLTPIPPRPTVAPVPTLGAAGPHPLLVAPAEAVAPSRPADEHPPTRPVGQTLDTRLDNPAQVGHLIEHPIGHRHGPVSPPSIRVAGSPAGDRALTLAREHATRHGRLPTVRELATLARVARGTAAAALKELRQHPASQPARKPASNATSQP
jgi:Protein of unknown function (DUF2637)